MKTTTLTICDGRINPSDGRCDKCYQPAQTSSSYCGTVYEVGKSKGEPVSSDTQEEHRILLDFARKMAESQQDIDPEIQRIIDKHLWDIL